jgi:hypothetical protein
MHDDLMTIWHVHEGLDSYLWTNHTGHWDEVMEIVDSTIGVGTSLVPTLSPMRVQSRRGVLKGVLVVDMTVDKDVGFSNYATMPTLCQETQRSSSRQIESENRLTISVIMMP